MSLGNLLGGDDAPTPSTIDASIGDVLMVLKNERRRRVLDHVYAAGDAVTLGALADDLAALENGPRYSSHERKRVYVGLYQCHLDPLDAMDAIAFDRDRGVVRPGPELDALVALQEYAREATGGSA